MNRITLSSNFNGITLAVYQESGSCIEEVSLQNDPLPKPPFYFLEKYQLTLFKDLQRLEFIENDDSISANAEEISDSSPEAILKAAYKSPQALASILNKTQNSDVWIKSQGGYRNPILTMAIEAQCDFKCLQLLIKHAKNKNQFVNRKGHNAISPLHAAFAKGLADLLPILLAYGADLQAISTTSNEENLFLDAVEDGNLRMVAFFHKAGFPLNYQDDDLCSALHYAAAAKQDHIVNYLIKHGANEKALNQEGMNYQDYAKKVLSEKSTLAVNTIKSFLLKKRGEALSFAEIIKNIPDVNIDIDEKGNTLLHLAMKHGLTDVTLSGILIHLVNYGANPWKKNHENSTPMDLGKVHLILAQQNASFFIKEAQELLNEIENATQHSDQTNQEKSIEALKTIKEVFKGVKKIYLTKLCLENILDPNEKIDEEGNTLLHLTMEKMITQTFQHHLIFDLIEKGANPFQKNNKGDTPIDSGRNSLMKKANTGGFHYLVEEGQKILDHLINASPLFVD